MKVGRPPAAFFKFFPATAGAGFVAPHLGLHGFSDSALVGRDPQWHPVSVDGHNGIDDLIGELAAPSRGFGQLKLVRTEVVFSEQSDRAAESVNLLQPAARYRHSVNRHARVPGYLDNLPANPVNTAILYHRKASWITGHQTGY